MYRKIIAGLAMACSITSVNVVEAGIPSASDMPLYVYATKRINCYKSGWIDSGDLVIISSVQSDGTAYGSYPLSNGSRTSRYFPVSEFGVNIRESNYIRYAPTNNTYVYRTPSFNSHTGMFGGNEQITVLSGNGNARLIVFRDRNSGRKMMGWVPYWDCWTESQVPGRNATSGNNIAQGALNGASVAINTNWKAKANAFINDYRWRNGTNWGGSSKSHLTGWGNGCAAYAADFVKYVFNKDNPRTGVYFTNLYDVRPGDVLAFNAPHWIVVLDRNGNNLRTAEANVGSPRQVRISNNYSIISSKVIKWGNVQYTLADGYHYN